MHLDLQFSVLISRWLPYIAPMPPMHPPWAPPWPLLEEPPHTSLYSLYQLADLTRQHCCPPILESKLQWDEQACLNLTNPIAACPVFCGWSTGVPTNFLNSKKPKIINNFELKTGQMHSRSPFADLTCCESSKPRGTLRFIDLSFLLFQVNLKSTVQSQKETNLAALRLSPCKHISSTLDWLIG